MGRQLRFYLLPEDIDSLLAHLREEAGLKLFLANSSSNCATEIFAATGERCYLTPSGSAPPPMQLIKAPNYWLVDTDSEVIEFDSCNYRDDRLIQGRMYYQTDLLSPEKDAILPKAEEFVAWAEAVFRKTKKVLQRDRELDAYVGQAAAMWRAKGGRFAESSNKVGLARER